MQVVRLNEQTSESSSTSSSTGLVVNCDRCGDYSLNFHWHCDICGYGDYDLCPSCFKASGGCGHPMIGRYVSNGKVVHRCGRKQCYFEGPTRESLETHYSESSIHGVCLGCWPRLDLGSKEALLNHWRTSPNHHWCDICEKDFASANNLQEHSKIHNPRQLECFGCARFFATYSAMMIHLESSNCPSGANETYLRKLAVQCYQHKHYVVPGMEHYLRDGCERSDADPERYLSYYSQCYECPDCDRQFDLAVGLQQHLLSPVHDDPAFRCPDADCDMRFTCISGLLQHVESDRCNQEVVYRQGSIGKMLHFIDYRLSGL